MLRYRCFASCAAVGLSVWLTSCNLQSTDSAADSTSNGGFKIVGTEPAASPKIEFPPLNPPARLQPGVLFHEVNLVREGVPMKVWIYLPEKSLPGKVPCVLIPPAGSTLLTGMALTEGDRQEHLPFVKAGFAVVAFDLDGSVANNDLRGRPMNEVLAACTAFMNANAGVANGKAALDLIAARFPGIDPQRIYAAGHSSAGTAALLLAARDPRIKGCAAFAPCTDVVHRLGDIHEITQRVPGYAIFIIWSSPDHHLEDLKCPVFLFHAQDDNNVPIGETVKFESALKKTNPKVTFVKVPQGGHAQALIPVGIPRAITWLKGLNK